LGLHYGGVEQLLYDTIDQLLRAEAELGGP